MISFDNVGKKYSIGGAKELEALKNVCLSINSGEKIGFLGLNGSGKSTLCKLIAGSEPPSSGKITKTSTVSWPIGVFNTLAPNLTGAENIKFISLLYGLDYKIILGQVTEMAGLDKNLNYQIKTYSAGMRAKLAFFLAFSINFDFYICDEITAVGDIAFRETAESFFKEIIAKKGLILCSHNQMNIRKNVESVYIINDNTISKKLSVEDGISRYLNIVNESKNAK